jgi:hypothetical protein
MSGARARGCSRSVAAAVPPMRGRRGRCSGRGRGGRRRPRGRVLRRSPAACRGARSPRGAVRGRRPRRVSGSTARPDRCTGRSRGRRRGAGAATDRPVPGRAWAPSGAGRGHRGRARDARRAPADRGACRAAAGGRQRGRGGLRSPGPWRPGRGPRTDRARRHHVRTGPPAAASRHRRPGCPGHRRAAHSSLPTPALLAS